MEREMRSMNDELRDWRAILVVSGVVAVFLELYCGVVLFECLGMPRPLGASIRVAMTAAFIATPWFASAAPYRMLRRSMSDMKSVDPSMVKLVKSMRVTLLSAYIAIMFCIVSFGGWRIH